MFFLIFTLTTLLVIALEVAVWRRLTPNVIAAFPCFVVVALATLVTPYFGFVRPVADLYLILAVFFAVGCLGSLTVVFLFRRYTAIYVTRPSFDLQGRGVLCLKVLAAVLCLFVALKSYLAYLAIGNIHDEEFSKILSHGAAGHSLVFLMIAAPVLLFACRRSDWVALLIVIASFALFFLRQVKGWFVVPVLFCFFMYWYAGRFRLDGRGALTAFLLLCLMVLMFFFVYLLGWASRSGFQLSFESLYSALEAISVHFMGYLVSGVLGFSELIRSSTELVGKDCHYLVASIYNILAAIQGEVPMSVVSDGFFVISEQHGKGSNVYTLWGTLLLRAGWLSFIVYLLLMMMLTALMVVQSRNGLIFLIYCYLVSFMAIGWFDYYYFHLAVYEGAILLMVMSVLLGYRRLAATGNSTHQVIGGGR